MVSLTIFRPPKILCTRNIDMRIHILVITQLDQMLESNNRLDMCTLVHRITGSYTYIFLLSTTPLYFHPSIRLQYLIGFVFENSCLILSFIAFFIISIFISENKFSLITRFYNRPTYYFILSSVFIKRIHNKTFIAV